MKRTIASLLFLIGLSFAVTAYAEVVTYFNDFSVGKIESGTYRVDDGSADYGTNLAPYYSNLRYYENGGSNLRFTLGDGLIILANAGGNFGTLQMDASNFLSSATNFDLTAGDLVYECFYTCTWHTGAGNYHHGISINNNQMTFIYHPGYQNGNGSIKGAFRIHGDFGEVTTNQNIGFVPKVDNVNDFTMMKLTIHRDDDAGNYIFTTEFGQATRTDNGWETTGYTYQYNHTCSIETIDAAGGIKSIGPYGYNSNNTEITNLRLVAPFSDESVAKAREYTAAVSNVVSSDRPTHWYKFDDPSTNIIWDYGSNPINGTGKYVDMSAISELRQVADFDGASYVATDCDSIDGPWTAEFLVSTTSTSSCQSLLSDNNYSLRLVQYKNAGVPGFTVYGVKDYVFKNPDDQSIALSSIISDDEWLHVAFVNDGESMLFYLNGELVGKNTDRLISLPATNIGIGKNLTADPFLGEMDYVALYDYALTAEQIWAHAFPESPQTPKFYDVNTDDIFAENWTIDGTEKKGVVFIEGEQNTATFSGGVALNANGGFEIGTGRNLTLAGAVSGYGSITKTGAGTLTLTNATSYEGGTTISEGTLKLSGSGTLGTGDVTIEDNATLEFAHDSEQTVSNYITGNGSVIKSGSGKLIMPGSYMYSGETTVSNGTLVVPSTAYLNTSKVTVESGATFQMGTYMNGDVDVKNGGNLVIGESGQTNYVSFGTLSLEGGTINFDFYDSASNLYDIFYVSSANLSSGVINLTFNGSSADDWLTVINDNYSGALPLISGSIVDYTTFNNNNSVTVSVNGSPSTDWKLTTDSYGLYLSANGAGPTPGGDWYYANTSDINLDSWTIDGTNKQGVKFTEGGDSATFAGGVTTSANGTFDIGSNQTLTVSNVISGDGALTKTGEGTLELSGDNTFTGGTTVSAGTLKLTKADIKGTLATGSTVTVDGATSVLTGHGDILGYSNQSVGTINLQNGGTLHNDSDNAHITVGAAVNMNNGVISAEDGWGNGTFGNFVFDNAINVLGGTDNKITAWKITLRQYDGTPGNAGGKITVAEGAKLTISSQIAAHDSPTLVPLVKLGDGELVLSGDCTYTTGTYVYGGTLRLEKVGDKGTLATGSTVTVDGATSLLTGHDDILGYGGRTVGTVNLQNGGTLHNDATPEQAAHITVGAAVNMNNGYITADPDAQGSDTYGNYVFDNAINVTGGTDNAISANQITLRQYDGTPGNAGGKITVADGAKLTISSLIKDPNGYYVPLIKQGAGNLVLTGENTFSTGTTISEGTLTLAGAGTTGASTVAIGDSGTLEFYVTSNEAPKQVNVTNSNAISGTGKIVKSGNGVLRFNNENAEGSVSASNFLVSAGELDFQGTYNGDLEVQRGATLSAGNSPGDLTVYGDVKIDAGATGLFEFSSFTADKEQQVFDQMFITGAGSFILDPGSTIKLSFLNGDAAAWSTADDPVYQLVFDENFVSETTDLSEFLETQYQGVFALEGTTEGLFLRGLGVIPVPEPGTGVPEPSTWALMLLGAAGLLYWRKKNA